MSDPIDEILRAVTGYGELLKQAVEAYWRQKEPVSDNLESAMLQLLALASPEFNPTHVGDSDDMLSGLAENVAPPEVSWTGLISSALGNPDVATRLQDAIMQTERVDLEDFDGFVDQLANQAKAERRARDARRQSGDIKVDRVRMTAVAAKNGFQPSIVTRLTTALQSGGMQHAIAEYNANSPAEHFTLRNEDGFFVSDLRKVLTIIDTSSVGVSNLKKPYNKTRQLLEALAALTE